MRWIPSVGSGRYSPGPGMVGLLEERAYQELRITMAFCSRIPPDNLAIDSFFIPNLLRLLGTQAFVLRTAWSPGSHGTNPTHPACDWPRRLRRSPPWSPPPG